MKVWEVLRSDSSTGGMGRLFSKGLFSTEELALAQVPGHIKWVEDYHGPYYPVTWEPPELSVHGPREWKASRGEKIQVVEREVLS